MASWVGLVACGGDEENPACELLADDTCPRGCEALGGVIVDSDSQCTDGSDVAFCYAPRGLPATQLLWCLRNEVTGQVLCTSMRPGETKPLPQPWAEADDVSGDLMTAPACE